MFERDIYPDDSVELLGNPPDYYEMIPKAYLANPFKRLVRNHVEWAKDILKKNFRIRWYLRFLRLGLAADMYVAYSHIEEADKEALLREYRRYNRKTKGEKLALPQITGSTVTMLPVELDDFDLLYRANPVRHYDIRAQLQHYMALNLEEINELPF